MKLSELNEWQNHIMDQILLSNKYRKKYLHTKKEMLLSDYWKTSGATICIVPRKVGKTELCKFFKQELGNKCYVYDAIVRPVFLEAYRNLTHSKTTLVIDEFLFLNQSELDSILSYNWREVLLLGSLRSL